MGLPVTIYRYTDAGAPQYTNGTPSELIDILKKVLVTGYGTKAGLGWTMEFENAGAYKVAFRNKVADGGSGGYVQFSSVGGVNTANTTLIVKCAVAMAAIDSFTKPLFTRNTFGGSTHRGWEIIGTSRGFYLIVHCTAEQTIGASVAGRAPWWAYIGDVESYTQNDQGCFTIATGTGSLSDVGGSGIGEQSDVYAQMNSADGANTNYMYSCRKPHYGTAGYSAIDGNAESRGVDHIMSPIQLTGAATAVDGGGVAQMNSKSIPYCRGVLPGFYMSTFAGYRTENWPIELTRDGVKWVLMRGFYYTGHWIKTGTWYD